MGLTLINTKENGRKIEKEICKELIALEKSNMSDLDKKRTSQNLFKQGEELLLQGQIRKARAYYNSSLKFDPDNYHAHIGLTCVLSDLKRVENISEEEILFHVNEAVRAKPDDINALNNAGVYYLLNEDYKNSIKYLSEAFKIDPNSMVINRHLGFAFFHDKCFEDCIPYLKRSQNILNNDSKDMTQQEYLNHIHGIYLRLGKSLYMVGKKQSDKVLLNQAKSYLAKLARAGLVDVETYNFLGNIFAGERKFKVAYYCFNKSCNLDKNQFAANYALGKYLYIADYFKEAVEYIKNAIRFAENSHEEQSAIELYNLVLAEIKKRQK